MKTVTVMLGGGVVGALQSGPGTMTWAGYDAVRDAVGNAAGAGAPTVTETGSADREF